MRQKLQSAAIICAIILAHLELNAQSDVLNHARSGAYYLGWDNTGTPGALDIKNAFTGTTYPINFFIGSSQKMIIDANGKLGIGTASPSTLLHVYNSTASTDVYLRIENTQTGNQSALQFKTGTTNADWIQYIPGSSTDLRFYRGADYMTLKSDGKVGIGVTSPATLLDVNGDINFAASNALYVGGNKVLWNGGVTSKIFLGVGAANAGGGGAGNSFFGNYAGGQVSGSNPFGNTYLGYYAGYGNNASISNGSYNTCVGYETMISNNTENFNTCVGYQAGSVNVSGENTFIGAQSGLVNTSGSGNAFLGFGAGVGNTTGGGNVFVGYGAAQNTISGASNTVIGTQAGGSGGSGGSFSSNTLIGYNAGYKVTTGGTNVMIGDNTGLENTTGATSVLIGSSAGKWNSTGGNNTIIGYHAGFGNGSSVQNHSDNSFYGYQAGKSVNTGSNNVFIGFQSGFNHLSNGANVYCGYKSGYSNSSGHSNSFYGQNSGFYNTTGENNVSLGLASTYYNATGSNNTNCGYGAGFGVSGVSTSNNSFFGYKAAYSCSTGSGNVAVGYQAGYTITTGSNNTFIGNSSNLNAGTYSNSGAFGYNTVVTASNKIYMGDANLSGCYNYPAAGWLSYSDQRFKFNVKEEVKGLEFILKLRPVIYQFDSKAATEFVTQNFPDSLRGNYLNGVDFSASTNKIQSGFLAQEVDQAAKDCGFSNSIVSPPSNDGDMYALSYGGFVVPLVKAVQELSKTLDSLKSEIVTLKGGGQRGNGSNSQGSKETTNQIDLANNSQPILYQNEPNPFDGSTVIRYFIPENISGNAFVVFYDMYGKEVNKLEIRERGFGKIEANTENLAAGIYSYSILVDGKAIDTKKMLKAK